MFKRITNLIKGFLGLFIKGLETKNPEALLELETENVRKQIAHFNEGLAGQAGLVENLLAQRKRLQEEAARMKAKATAALNVNQRELAGEFAVKMKTAENDLAAIVAQLETAEAQYQQLTNARDVSVKAAREKIDSLKRALGEMKNSKAMAELNEAAAGLISNIGGTGDTLNRLTETIEEERQKAAGRARVARDSLDLTDVHLAAAEQRATADLALAELEASLGISSPKALGMQESNILDAVIVESPRQQPLMGQ